IVVNAASSQIGNVGSLVGTGVLATTATGGITITTTTTPIDALINGVNAQVTGGGSGGVTINAGAITANNGTGVISGIVGGTGNTSITLNGAITSTLG